MKLSFIIPAGDNEIFTEEAFDSVVGRAIVVNGEPGVINNALVDENGKSVTFEITIDPAEWVVEYADGTQKPISSRPMTVEEFLRR